MAAHHVANVFLGQLVMRQVQGLETVLVEGGSNLRGLTLAVRSQANKDMGFDRVGHAVVELGDVTHRAGQGADQFAKALEAATLLRNGDGKQGFAFLTHLSALGDKAQAVEVHVGTAQNRRISLALGLVLGDILLDGCDTHGARWLDDAAGVNEDVFNGRAHGVGIDANEVIHQVAGNAEGFFPHQLDGGAI